MAKKGTNIMLLFALIVGAIVLSITVNSFIKSIVLESLYEGAVKDALENGADENGHYHGHVDKDSLFYTTIAVVLINNLIPFALGAAIGLYAIL